MAAMAAERGDGHPLNDSVNIAIGAAAETNYQTAQSGDVAKRVGEKRRSAASNLPVEVIQHIIRLVYPGFDHGDDPFLPRDALYLTPTFPPGRPDAKEALGPASLDFAVVDRNSKLPVVFALAAVSRSWRDACLGLHCFTTFPYNVPRQMLSVPGGWRSLMSMITPPALPDSRKDISSPDALASRPKLATTAAAMFDDILLARKQKSAVVAVGDTSMQTARRQRIRALHLGRLQTIAALMVEESKKASSDSADDWTARFSPASSFGLKMPLPTSIHHPVITCIPPLTQIRVLEVDGSSIPSLLLLPLAITVSDAKPQAGSRQRSAGGRGGMVKSWLAALPHLSHLIVNYSVASLSSTTSLLPPPPILSPNLGSSGLEPPAMARVNSAPARAGSGSGGADTAGRPILPKLQKLTLRLQGPDSAHQGTEGFAVTALKLISRLPPLKALVLDASHAANPGMAPGWIGAPSTGSTPLQALNAILGAAREMLEGVESLVVHTRLRPPPLTFPWIPALKMRAAEAPEAPAEPVPSAPNATVTAAPLVNELDDIQPPESVHSHILSAANPSTLSPSALEAVVGSSTTLSPFQASTSTTVAQTPTPAAPAVRGYPTFVPPPDTHDLAWTSHPTTLATSWLWTSAGLAPSLAANLTTLLLPSYPGLPVLLARLPANPPILRRLHIAGAIGAWGPGSAAQNHLLAATNPVAQLLHHRSNTTAQLDRAVALAVVAAVGVAWPARVGGHPLPARPQGSTSPPHTYTATLPTTPTNSFGQQNNPPDLDLDPAAVYPLALARLTSLRALGVEDWDKWAPTLLRGIPALRDLAVLAVCSTDDGRQPAAAGGSVPSGSAGDEVPVPASAIAVQVMLDTATGSSAIRDAPPVERRERRRAAVARVIEGLVAAQDDAAGGLRLPSSVRTVLWCEPPPVPATGGGGGVRDRIMPPGVRPVAGAASASSVVAAPDSLLGGSFEAPQSTTCAGVRIGTLEDAVRRGSAGSSLNSGPEVVEVSSVSALRRLVMDFERDKGWFSLAMPSRFNEGPDRDDTGGIAPLASITTSLETNGGVWGRRIDPSDISCPELVEESEDFIIEKGLYDGLDVVVKRSSNGALIQRGIEMLRKASTGAEASKYLVTFCGWFDEVDTGISGLVTEGSLDLMSWYLTASKSPKCVARMLAISKGLATGMAYINDLGIIHNDIKPGNVFVDAQDNPRIGDFGVATNSGEPLVGWTPQYFDKESLELEADEKGDSWLLGATLWEFWSNEAFNADEEIRLDRIPNRKIQDVLKKLLRSREHRSTAKQVLNVLIGSTTILRNHPPLRNPDPPTVVDDLNTTASSGWTGSVNPNDIEIHALVAANYNTYVESGLYQSLRVIVKRSKSKHRIQREIEFLSAASTGEFVVDFSGWFEEVDTGIIGLVVREYPTDLKTWSRQALGSVLLDEQMLLISEGIAKGLAHIHNLDFIHNNIKPTTIFVDNFNKPFIGDFSVATKRGEMSMGYSEQYFDKESLGAAPDEKSDSWLLGATLWELWSYDTFHVDRNVILKSIPNLTIKDILKKLLRPRNRRSTVKEVLGLFRPTTTDVVPVSMDSPSPLGITRIDTSQPDSGRLGSIDPAELKLRAVVAANANSVIERGDYRGLRVIVKRTTKKVLLQREIDFLRRASSSEFVVSFLGWFEERDTGITGLVMQKCSMDLTQWTPNTASFADRDLKMVRISQGIAQGLAYINSIGIIHNDLKPMNVFVDDFDKPYIGDFGVATNLGERLVGYTTQYFDQESRELTPDVTSDAWLLGATLWEFWSLEAFSVDEEIYFNHISNHMMVSILKKLLRPRRRRSTAKGILRFFSSGPGINNPTQASNRSFLSTSRMTLPNPDRRVDPREQQYWDAVAAGDIIALKSVLSANRVEVDSKRDGFTGLHVACQRNLMDVVKLLLEQEADPLRKDANGKLPIQLSTSADVWRALACKMPAPDGDLFDAVKRGDDVTTRLIVAQTDVNINEEREYGRTALHMAAIHGQLEIAHLLLQNGADIDGMDNLQQTPLHLAALHGRIDVARFLLENGANLESRSIFERTPLHSAVHGGKVDVVRLLLMSGANGKCTNNSGWSLLHVAALHGNVDVARFLIEQGLDIECKDSRQFTPLITAAYHGQVVVVQLLLEKGANVDARCRDQLSARAWALERGRTEVAELMAGKGATKEKRAVRW
ncbi:Tyrosine-protein kinase csk-1 [Phlyctochytrium bullatum]|nr:Tyrosine-protein kinase csk-1 [Phlyctochytrium bullatum]